MFEESGQISRLTFEEVQKNQEILIALIKKLERGKRLTVKEVDGFDAIYARATLGFGVHQYLEPDGQNVQSVFQGLATMPLDAVVDRALEFGGIQVRTKGVAKSRRTIPNTELWSKIRKTLKGHVFGEALQLAVKLSPEKEWGRHLGGPGSAKS